MEIFTKPSGCPLRTSNLAKAISILQNREADLTA
jgi:hypothetical protein